MRRHPAPAWGRRLSRLAVYGVLAAFAWSTVAPFVLVAITSVKTPAELVRGVLRLPSSVDWHNYAVAWSQGHLGAYFLNSIVVAVPVVAISLVLSVLSGYALTLVSGPGRDLLLTAMLLGFIVPLEGLIVPLYYTMRRWNLINTYWALILPQVGLSVSFGTYLMWAALRAVPASYVEAALMEGAGPLAVLAHVLVPLVRPSLQALTVFLFIWTWNEFLIPLVVTTQDRLRTLPVGMAFFQGRYTIDVPVLAAGATLVAVPLIVVYVAFQRAFIEGITAGGTRG